jgi:FHS family L-fucose permease-like MFS transporter
MFLFGMIGTALVGPNLSTIEREYGIDHSQFGAAFAVIQVACSALVLGLAARTARFDSSRAFTVSLVVQGLGFVTVYLSRTVWQLALGWALITLGTILGSVANNVSARLWPGDPRRGVTLLHGFNGLGKVAGPLVAAGCLLLGWRLSFLAVGLVTLALLGGFLVSGSALSSLSPADGPAAGPAAAAPTPRSGLYWLCTLPFGLIAGADVCFAALLPSYYERVHGVSPEGSSLLLTAHLAGLAVGRFVFVYLSERLGNNRVIGLCLAAGLSVSAALLPHPALWALGAFGVGWMFSSTWATYYAQVARFFGARPQLLDYGSALGNAVGIAACVYGASALAERWPPAALLTGPAAMWLFGAVYFLTPLSRKP